MKNKQIISFTIIILVISLVLGFMIHFSSIIAVIKGHVEDNGSVPGIVSVLGEVLISTIVIFVMFLLNYFIIKPFDSSVRLKIVRLLQAICITIIAVAILTEILFALKNMIEQRPAFGTFSIIYLSRDIIIGMIVITGMYFMKTIYDRQTVRIENEVLKNEILLSQFESLKNQISPHFLFNSLTALKELVDRDTNDAKLYISHLSMVLRYTLSSAESRSKTLQEELEVADSYIHLVKIRYGSSLVVEKSIDEKFRNHLVPPLSIQILIENAIKHNEISKDKPLTIRIETQSGGYLSVSNPLQEKVSKELSTGIGLANLSRQYRYLAGQDILISNRNNEFRVEIPLVKA